MTTINTPRTPRASLAERNSMIEAEYLAGRSLESIGRQLGMTRERVRQILETRGVKRRDSGHHARNAYDSWVALNGPAVDAAFDKLHSVRAVCVANPHWNATWVRRHLEPRLIESVQLKTTTKTFSDKELLDALRAADKDLPRLTSAGYAAWRVAQAEAGVQWPAAITITLRFGSWSRAKSMALGTEVRGVARVRSWTPEQAQQAVAAYVRWSLAHGRRPSSAGYIDWSASEPDVPSAAYLRVLTNKTWSELLLDAYAGLS